MLQVSRAERVRSLANGDLDAGDIDLGAEPFRNLRGVSRFEEEL